MVTALQKFPAPATNEDQAVTNLVPHNLEQLYKLSHNLSGSALIPNALRNRPADVAVVIMTGLELGLSPMQALRLIHVWNGKPSLSADLIVALVKRSPACKYFRLLESNARLATYETLREGEPEPTRMSFTVEQAQKAGLLNKDVWRNYPEPMLRARAAAYLARIVYPDVVGGIYTEDEGEEIRRNNSPGSVHAVSATVVDEAASVEVTPAPAAEMTPTAAQDAVVEPPAAPVTTSAEAAPATKDELDAEVTAALAKVRTVTELNTLKRKFNREFPQGHPQREAMIAACKTRETELKSR
ncbi:MAG: hypothetical protein AB2A00_08565 [Myxococcota bacterium]